ncbi:MAG: LytR C-terminal domain-containing protein [Candidatus Cloacimonetes bacterium]|nr:LytR C-terminal domain-containing protein [Candidatus Cloacimonadota bacterium]
MRDLKNKLAQNKYFLLISVIILASIMLYIGINSKDRRETESYLSESDFPSIRIMIQNGCGFVGVAQNVRNAVSQKNIDVVGVSNSRKFIYNETIIIVKHDDEIDLQRLKNMTGIENVIYAVNENYFVPFIIIAGRDYQRFFGL